MAERIIITAPEFFSREAYHINRLFSNGLPVLHLRKPGAPDHAYRKLIEQISQEYHPKIVIHQHYVLTNAYRLKGIHLPEKVRKKGLKHQEHKVISTSFHQLEEMTNCTTPLDYAFFSPVMPSLSKEGYLPMFSPEKISTFLKENRAEIPFKIIALGGMTADNYRKTIDLGFDGVAFLGAVWQEHNPLKIWQKIKGKEKVF